MEFTLVIVGRPNVGKSTLFNRLAGKRLALVDNTPGVTRDRREAKARLGDLSFRIVDTAGLAEGDPSSLFGRMRAQTEEAIKTADAAIMMIDARAGLMSLDEYFANWLRQKSIPTILVANKCEGSAGQAGVIESYSLGLGEPIPVSAEHGEGLAELYELLRPLVDAQASESSLPGDDDGSQSDSKRLAGDPITPGLKQGDLDFSFADSFVPGHKPMRLAIVGRPNVGKSTLINRLLGEERLITGPEAGLTRDSIAVDWDWDGHAICLFDTAGLRKKAKVQERLEQLSVSDSLRAIRFAEVVVLLLDARDGLERQDMRIASQVLDEGRGLVVALNKWDLIEDRLSVERKVREALDRTLPHARGLELVLISALEGGGVHKMMPAVWKTYELWNRRIQTAPLNEWLRLTMEQHPPPLSGGRRLKIRYMVQVKTRPPTFALFVNRPKNLPGSYLRYLENELRRAFRLPATPLRFLLRQGENPYAGRRKRR
jgi:GTP-binding protein